MLLHILIPSILKMREQLLKFCMRQTCHGQQKLRMVLDLRVGKHHPLLLEEEKRIETSHIPHPFFWVYEGFRRMPSRYMWHGPIEPCQSMSLCSCLTSSCWCGAS